MNLIAKEIVLVNLDKELKYSYLNYAMSVIIGRALPDVRDGLKPVHRRILYAMYLLHNIWNKSYKKSARIVGDVIGKYHPHGDSAVYESIVRLVQTFMSRYPLIDGQGNFGSIDGDSAAAMRYTEIKLSKIAQELLGDLDKNTVKFIHNYDNTELMPIVLPTKLPNLLINGTSGIAVGMATNIPPHNLIEIINGCLAFINNNNISIKELLTYIPGPDFPTGGIIYGNEGILNAYESGKGKIILRMNYKIIINKITKQSNILIYQLPYQVNKTKLLTKINELIKFNKIEGISKLRDESDKEGLRIIIEPQLNFDINIIINNLYKFTSLEITYNINMVALDNNQPKLMNLKELIGAFIAFRGEIITKRTLFDLTKAKNKLHRLEGVLMIINNLDYVINLIKNSSDIVSAQNKLLTINFSGKLIDKIIDKYYLTLNQINYILNLKLQQLTNIEQTKIITEYSELLTNINKMHNLLNNHDKLMEVIKLELIELKVNYGDQRKTKINNHNNYNYLLPENLINKKEIFISLSKKGFITAKDVSDYVLQKRTQKSKTSIKLFNLDFIRQFIITHNLQHLLCLSNMGKLYDLAVNSIKSVNKFTLGKPINNLITLQKTEKIINIIPINNDNNSYYYIITKQGIIKKILLNKIKKIKQTGIIVISIYPQDNILQGNIGGQGDDILIFTKNGKVLRFNELEIKPLGRFAHGIKGINLSNNDKVLAFIVISNREEEILTITSNGYGKRTLIKDYPIQSRGLKGVKALKFNQKKGNIIKAIKVNALDQIMIMTNLGNIIRIKVAEINLIHRNTQGLNLIKLRPTEQVVDAQIIINNN